MKTFLLATAICCMVTNASQAALVFSIDLDPSQPGIQTALAVAPGANFQADIIMELTDTTTSNLYGITLNFDSDSLTYVTGQELAPHPLFTDMLAPLARNGRDIEGINAATTIGVDGPQAPLSGVIARLNFTAPNASVGDIHFSLFESILDGSTDNDSSQIFPLLNGATLNVSAVPEPSSLGAWIGVGLLTVGLRRRQRGKGPR